MREIKEAKLIRYDHIHLTKGDFFLLSFDCFVLGGIEETKVNYTYYFKETYELSRVDEFYYYVQIRNENSQEGKRILPVLVEYIPKKERLRLLVKGILIDKIIEKNRQ